ncbi:hypothetical protein DFH09DRAFT_1150156 [Mycena vulgaris]|nr:hypothetical protein DFH09DRAFT_1150156 [Mycena vulgaris]
MILDIEDPKDVNITVNCATIPDDPPPPYSWQPSQSGSGSGSTSGHSRPPAGVRPTNFLSLSRGNVAIRDSYAIDPRIKIPQLMLPPLASDETEATRWNVFLHTTNGPIDVDLFVVGDSTAQKVDTLIKSTNGTILAKLHASDHARPSIHVKAQSSNAPITIYLPLSFRGPVTIRGRPSNLRVSERLAAGFTMLGASTMVGEAHATCRGFIGDCPVGPNWLDEWAGDELAVESENGSVKLGYEEEPNGGPVPQMGFPAFSLDHIHTAASGMATPPPMQDPWGRDTPISQMGFPAFSLNHIPTAASGMAIPPPMQDPWGRDTPGDRADTHPFAAQFPPGIPTPHFNPVPWGMGAPPGMMDPRQFVPEPPRWMHAGAGPVHPLQAGPLHATNAGRLHAMHTGPMHAMRTGPLQNAGWLHEMHAQNRVALEQCRARLASCRILDG